MEQKLQTYLEIFEKIPQTVYIYDPETLAFLEANEEAEKKYGYSREEFLSMTIKDIRPSQDIPRLLEFLNNSYINDYRSAIWRHYKKDGTLFYVKSSSNEINYQGKKARIVISEDVTQIRYYEQRLSTQYEVVKIIAEFKSLDKVIPEILSAVCTGIEFDIGEFWLLDKEMNHLSMQSIWSSKEYRESEFIKFSRKKIFKKGEGLPGSVWDKKKINWIENLDEDKNFARKTFSKEVGLKAAVAFPVFHKDNFFGVMCFFRFEQYTPDLETLQMFESLGSQLGNFIEQKTVEEEKNKLLAEIANEVTISQAARLAVELKIRQQAAIAELGRIALDGMFPGELLKTAVQILMDVTGSEYISILEFLPKEKMFLLRAGTGWDKWLVGNIKLGAGNESQAGYTLLTGKPVIADDLSTETRFAKPGFLFNKNVKSGMSVPIQGKENPFGVLSIHSSRHHKFTEDDTQFLVAIANIISASIGRKKTETELELSLKEKEALLREIHHRVKNNLQVISSLLNLQSKLIKDPEALELFNESQTRIKSMALIHEKLYRSKNLLEIDFENYLSDLLANLFSSYRIGDLIIRPCIEVKDIYLTVDVAVVLGLITNELISNSLKYAFKKVKNNSGEIHIQMTADLINYNLVVKDNGCGLPENFNFRETPTLGLQIVNTLVEQLGGKIQAFNDNGTVFKITFPKPDFS